MGRETGQAVTRYGKALHARAAEGLPGMSRRAAWGVTAAAQSPLYIFGGRRVPLGGDVADQRRSLMSGAVADAEQRGALDESATVPPVCVCVFRTIAERRSSAREAETYGFDAGRRRSCLDSPNNNVGADRGTFVGCLRSTAQDKEPAAVVDAAGLCVQAEAVLGGAGERGRLRAGSQDVADRHGVVDIAANQGVVGLHAQRVP